MHTLIFPDMINVDILKLETFVQLSSYPSEPKPSF